MGSHLSYITYTESAQLDQLLISTYKISMDDLIELAGLRIKQWIDKYYFGAPILGVIGKGNNALDVLSAFMQLDSSHALSLYVCDDVICEHPKYKACLNSRSIKIVNSISRIPDDAVILDGIFGTGLNRSMSHSLARLIHELNELSVPVISIDVPSGMNETGLGPCINADITLTMMLPKKVFLDMRNRHHCGDIYLLNFNLPISDSLSYDFLDSSTVFMKI